MSDSDSMVERKALPLSVLEEFEDNPNKMSARAFDLLVHNMQSHGCTENIVVRPIGKSRYQIISGHHRVKAAQYLGWDSLPCAIIVDPDFDDEAATFQLVRMNAIHGRLDPEAFIKHYEKVAMKYGDDLLQDMFGFAEEAEFKKLIAATAESLPSELKDKFKEAAKEVKTIDGLAKLLNELFTKYGDTTPYSYMIFDYGGQRNFWLRIEAKTFNALQLIGELCVETQHSMDDVLGELIRRVARGDLGEVMQDIVDSAPKVVIPTGFLLTPTKDNLDSVAALGD